MLSKNDIQQIREVVREEVTLQVDPLKQDIGGLKQGMTTVKKDLKSLHAKTSHIQKTLDVAINMFDRNHINHEKRIKKVELHLGLSSS